MRFHPQSSSTPLGRPKEVKKWEKSPLYLFYLTAFMPFLVVNEVNNENKITTEPARVGKKLLELKSENIFLCLLKFSPTSVDMKSRRSWKGDAWEQQKESAPLKDDDKYNFCLCSFTRHSPQTWRSASAMSCAPCFNLSKNSVRSDAI